MQSSSSLPLPQPAVSDYIGHAEARTVWELFCQRVDRSPDRVAYRAFDPEAQLWGDHSWRDIAERVGRIMAALAQERLQPGDRMALMLPNGIDWVCCDVAAHAMGLIVVALYPTDTPASNAYILGHCDARLLVAGIGQWRAIAPLAVDFPALERVWIGENGIPPAESDAEPIVRRLDQILATPAMPPPPHPVAPHELATLIYTSGTTGRPKGVMLSHHALLWNAEAAASFVPPLPGDLFLSILPLAHAFERTVGHYLPMAGGCTVAYARSPQHLLEDMATLRPTALLAVPRLYERIHAAVFDRAGRNPIKRKAVELAASIGWHHSRAAQSKQALPGIGARLIRPMLQRLVAKPILARFGGRLRVAISGGAPLDERISRFLIGLGLPLIEGYGLTEAGPVVAATALDDTVVGSVGRPPPGVEVMLSDRGELLVRSPSTMIGYWKDQEQTKAALSETGWLSTGDMAEISDGRLFIRGRFKDIIVLSVGEKVNPNAIEAEILLDPLLEQAMVAGAGKPHLVALLVLNQTAWMAFARRSGLDPAQPDALSARKEIVARLERRLAKFPRHMQIRAVHVSLEPWTIDSGLLTPTLKVKRAVAQRVFADEIEGLYREVADKANRDTRLGA